MQKVLRFFIAHYELEQIARKSKSKMINNNQKQYGTHVRKQHFATKIFLLFFFGVLLSCNASKEREELFVIKSGNKYGFINQKGDIVITPQFEKVYGFGDYSIAPFKMDGKWGYLNKKGEIVVAAQFEEAKTFSVDSLARFKMDGKWGYINTDGRIVIPAHFEYASPMDDGYALVVIDDELGEKNIQSLYETISKQEEFIFDFGVIDKNGKLKKIKIPNAYINQELDDHRFSEGLAPIEIIYLNKNDSIYHNAYTYIDYNGDTITKRKRIELESLPEELIISTSGNGGMIDYSHNKISRKFHDGRAAFCVTKFNKETMCLIDKYGFYDKDGDSVIGPKYEMVSTFSDGMAMIMVDNKYGYIDTIGNVIIEPSFDGWGYFKNGICAVKSNDKWGFINKLGEYVINPSFEMVSNFSEGLSWVKQDNKWGAIDTCGNVVIPIRYVNQPYQFNRGLSLVVSDGKWLYINKTGDTIWKDEAIDLDIPKSVWDIGMDDEALVEENRTKYISYYQQNIRELDPIEGLYQVYCKEVNRDNYSGITNTISHPSEYWAIFNLPDNSSEMNERNAFAQVCKCFCENCGAKINHNQYLFKRIGSTNTYNINGAGGEDGKLQIDNPIQFSFSIEWGRKGSFVGTFEYELIKDYPTAEMYEDATTDWSGTGFAIDDGYIATNYHVINGAGKIYISWKEGDHTEKLNAQLVATDEKNDIAILKIIDSRFKGFDNIPYGFNTALANEGEEIFVLGYPLTSTMGEEIKLTNGIISSTKGYKDDASMYQISAPIQPGNSGGPLFDSDGNVIGIIRAKHSEAENAGYAVKAIYLENLIKSSGISASVPRTNKIHSKSLAKKVKKVKGFVYKIECSK